MEASSKVEQLAPCELSAKFPRPLSRLHSHVSTRRVATRHATKALRRSPAPPHAARSRDARDPSAPSSALRAAPRAATRALFARPPTGAAAPSPVSIRALYATGK